MLRELLIFQVNVASSIVLVLRLFPNYKTEPGAQLFWSAEPSCCMPKLKKLYRGEKSRTDGKRMASQKDSRRIQNGWQKDGRRTIFFKRKIILKHIINNFDEIKTELRRIVKWIVNE